VSGEIAEQAGGAVGAISVPVTSATGTPPTTSDNTETPVNPVSCPSGAPLGKEDTDMGDSGSMSGCPSKRPRLEIEDAVSKEVRAAIVANMLGGERDSIKGSTREI
jgi:hypothetical protein